MDKISGILPSTSRIKSVDLREAGAARPGMPSFGRPIGTSELSNSQNRATTAQAASAVHGQLMDARSKSQNDAAIAQKITDGFFMKRFATPSPESTELEMPIIDEMSPAIEPLQIDEGFEMSGGVDAEDVGLYIEEPEAEVDLDQPIAGRYLDVMV
ncbi:MAG: hypothetical protein H6626_14310 [Pseudobdellovibrionaceae bacterium]|nr:hypothetical protein [Bdellovibrionales bacterium]USN47341.1 MAG: hypothetical protein H6626_14310 [Pseudobdellovibrionaceae bacterium]